MADHREKGRRKVRDIELQRVKEEARHGERNAFFEVLCTQMYIDSPVGAEERTKKGGGKKGEDGRW